MAAGRDLHATELDRKRGRGTVLELLISVFYFHSNEFDRALTIDLKDSWAVRGLSLENPAHNFLSHH